MSKFQTRLWYSIGNEDWKTEQTALKIESENRVVCVTASGDRPLNLLTNSCKELITIDSNPFQNALFELKKVAIEQLSYRDYLAFLGVHPHPNRLKVYGELKKSLSPSTTMLWEKYSKKIAQGVIYQGVLERFLKQAATCLNIVRGKKIQRLFSCQDVAEQRACLEREWKTPICRKLLYFVFHPSIIRLCINDPGLYENENIAHAAPAGQQLYERLHASLEGILAKDSLLLTLLFRGKISHELFPPYLNEEGVYKIKPNLDRVRFETLDLISFLEKSESNYFDRFSVSDVASYMSRENFHRLVKEIYRTAKPGARFCIRQLFSDYHLPEPFAQHMKREKDLEQSLEKEDRCCVYRFTVGTIEK